MMGLKEWKEFSDVMFDVFSDVISKLLLEEMSGGSRRMMI